MNFVSVGNRGTFGWLGHNLNAERLSLVQMTDDNALPPAPVYEPSYLGVDNLVVRAADSHLLRGRHLGRRPLHRRRLHAGEQHVAGRRVRRQLGQADDADPLRHRHLDLSGDGQVLVVGTKAVHANAFGNGGEGYSFDRGGQGSIPKAFTSSPPAFSNPLLPWLTP